jgi:hypothetical protein
MDSTERERISREAFEYLTELSYGILQDPRIAALTAAEFPATKEAVDRASNALYWATRMVNRERYKPLLD